MYVPRAFAVDDDAAWDLLDASGVGTLVVATPAGLRSVFAPVVADRAQRRLWGHVARGNELVRVSETGDEVLRSFMVAHGYVSPNYYRSRTPQFAQAPTWNYVTVEVRGSVSWHDDATVVEDIVRSLTETFEGDRDDPWRVDDAPRDYIDRLLRGIVGFEIAVTDIIGAAKLSQNKSDDDRDAIRAEFATHDDATREVARWMERS